MTPRPTFEEFLEALRELEREGELVVTKWPTGPNDEFQVQMLKDEDGKPLEAVKHKP